VGNGVWELEDPIRISISSQGIQESPAEARIQLGEAPSTTIDTMHLNALQLRSAIHDVEASGYNATTYRVDFYTRLAAPFSCFLLPMVVLLFAVTGPPFPSPAHTLLVSIILGVGYILLTGVCTSLGYHGTFPPFLAGGGPILILVAGVGWLVRHRNG
jgi:lipopolysaccharide export system permease protein